MINNWTIFQIIITLFCIGAFLSLFFKNKRYSNILTYVPPIIASILSIILSVNVISSGESLHASLWGNIPTLFDLPIYIDGISSFFILILGLTSFAISLYSIGYSKHYETKNGTSVLGFLFNFFILSMLLVVTSNSVFSFLFFWEIMALISFLLVIYEHEHESNLKSGMTYLVMTHFGTAFILASFLILYVQTNSFSFDVFRQTVSSTPMLIKDIVFILAFIGFGIKAGIVPFHIWLPQAYPSAPSNASALMSAVMTKTAIYGLVRFIFDYSGLGPSMSFVWWGLLLLSIGAISSVVGVLYALVEKDIKRALAFSSIENIGIIFIGLGLSVIFAAFNLPSLSILALVASMYHTLNHAVFKSLLFMCAGSIDYVIHTKNMESMGGLIRKMPWTALLFLIGVISISGLPPLNGFISEWLTMQSLLSTSYIMDTNLQILIAFISLAFALTIGVGAATFVKIFAVSFLSKSRSEQALNAIEVPRTMLAGKGVIAVIAILLGILPFIGINLITSAFNLKSFSSNNYFSSITLSNVSGSNFASLAPFTVLLMLASVTVSLYVFIKIIGKTTNERVFKTWDCGFGDLNERMEYSATSLSQPLRKVFKILYKPRNKITREFYAESNPYLRKTVKIDSTIRNIFEEILYAPIITASIFIFNKIRMLQTGKVNTYLLYIMITLVLLLIFVRITP